MSYTTSYYFGIFIVLCIIVLALVVMSPTQNSFFDLKLKFPKLYKDLHSDTDVYKLLIEEILKTTGVSRIDFGNEINIGHTDLIWLDAKKSLWGSTDLDYVKGNIMILPLFYSDTYYTNINHFPLLMNILYNHPNILNVFFWKLESDAAFTQHIPDSPNNTNEKNILGHKVLRYTLPINVLTINEEECSLWVNGQMKRMAFDNYVLWDPNKEFSLHNYSDTDSDILFLNIDLYDI